MPAAQTRIEVFLLRLCRRQTDNRQPNSSARNQHTLARKRCAEHARARAERTVQEQPRCA
jgi:hypothetical protein